MTKKEIHSFVRHQLSTNEKWARAALLRIYDRQTENEKAAGVTLVYNNIGFSGAHSEIMSSFAEQLRRKGWLSPKQMKLVFRIIPKYTRQIVEISDQAKLQALVAAKQSEIF